MLQSMKLFAPVSRSFRPMPARPDLNALKRQRHLETDVYRAYAQEPASMTYWDDTATQGLFGVPMSKGSQRLPRRKFGNLLITILTIVHLI